MSGLLSVLGWKVLHIDRNNYYGGDCASLNLTNLYAKVRLVLTKRRHVCRHLFLVEGQSEMIRYHLLSCWVTMHVPAVPWR